MSTLTYPNQIANDQTADGQEVMENFNAARQFVNEQMLHRDGSVAMTGPLLLPGDPTAPNHAARKEYVDSFIPAGTILMWGGSSAPSGWALCNGGLHSKTAYPETYAAIGNAYGEDGANFRVPDLRGRFPVGLGSSSPLNARGNTGGWKNAMVVQHNHNASTGNQSASHRHNRQNHQHTLANANKVVRGEGGGQAFMLNGAQGLNVFGPYNQYTISVNNSGGGNTGTQDASHNHNVTVQNSGESGTNRNLPPYVVVNFIIRMA